MPVVWAQWRRRDVADVELIERLAEEREDAGHPDDEREPLSLISWSGAPQLETVVDPAEDRAHLWRGRTRSPMRKRL